MATAHDHTDYTPGEMPIAEQVSTFHGVMGLFKWGSLVIGALVLMLVLWFCTPAGFVTAAVVSLIMVVVGVFALRSKPAASH